MGRIRSVKPEFFKHEGLFDLEREFSTIPSGLIRLAFEGLWLASDREGRFPWRPRQLKLDILPYDEVDFSRVLHALATRGFVVPYACGTEVYGYIPTFKAHQIINCRESESRLPAPTKESIDAARTQMSLPLSFQSLPDACATREARVTDASATREVYAHDLYSGEGKGREGKGREVGTRHDAVPSGPAVVELTLNTGKPYGITQVQIDKWAIAFPSVDIVGELRRMAVWLDANPQKRKTAGGILRFVATWLGKEQDRGGGGAGARSVPARSNPGGSSTKAATDIIAERRNARAQAAGAGA